MSIYEFLSLGKYTPRDLARDMRNYSSNLEKSLMNYMIPGPKDHLPLNYSGRDLLIDAKKSLKEDYSRLREYSSKFLEKNKSSLKKLNPNLEESVLGLEPAYRYR